MYNMCICIGKYIIIIKLTFELHADDGTRVGHFEKTAKTRFNVNMNASFGRIIPFKFEN